MKRKTAVQDKVVRGKNVNAHTDSNERKLKRAFLVCIPGGFRCFCGRKSECSDVEQLIFIPTFCQNKTVLGKQTTVKFLQNFKLRKIQRSTLRN